MMAYGPGLGAVEMVETYGEADLEYAAIRKACVLLDGPNRGTLEIRGDDRLGFLNRMVTQELSGMEPMRARRSFWLNRKGRIVGDLVIAELGGRMLVDVDVHTAAAVAESLAAYVITEDVEIVDVSDRLHRLSLHGPTGPALLGAAGAHEGGPARVGELGEGGACVMAIAGAEVSVVRQDLTGEVGLELTMATDQAAAVWGRLIEVGSPVNGEGAGSVAGRVRLRPTGWGAVNAARIEAGRALMFADFTGESLPAECGSQTLHDRVSFTKGCYLGQEVVARMHSLGQPKQTLVGLRPAGEPPRDERGLCRQPLGGSMVTADAQGHEGLGVVTSSTISPMLGGVPAMFAMVRTAAAVEGHEVWTMAEGEPMRCRVHLDLGHWSRDGRGRA